MVFFVVPIPLLYEYGLAGYGWGMVAMSLVNAFVRSHFLRQLFPTLRMAPHAFRAMSPTLPPVLVVLAMRLGAEDGREAWMAGLEFCVFVGLTLICAVAFERRLLREIVGYLGRPRPAAGVTEPEVATH